MTDALIAGVVAGLAIAVPVGAIGILIIETGIRRGFRVAWAAGAGAATADGIYASIAAAFGVVLATVIAPWERPLRVLAIVLLVLIAVRGLLVVRDALRDGRPASPAASVAPGHRAAPEMPAGRGARATYAAFLGLTLLNPQTVVYFAALILGLGATGTGPADKVAFVAGAAGSSLAWQTVVALVGAVLHRRLSPGIRIGVSLAGNLLILAFAAAIARDLAA